MSIYCTRGQHHRCDGCDCGCHPEEENVTLDFLSDDEIWAQEAAKLPGEEE